jgi:8-oxo-dGTP pyrophosphatase MutT (NUDIX family)
MRLAATVMLVRDGPVGGIEVFMLRRSDRSAFAPDAFVFPGGTVDPVDYDGPPVWPSERIDANFRATIPHELPASEPPVDRRAAEALVRAAVRELHEEAGIAVDPTELGLFSHWITPPTEPRRYNTHFFIARAPQGSLGVADAVETHDAVWIVPRDALHHYHHGQFRLVYPTIKHLERLQTFDTSGGVLAFARRKSIQTIMPDRAPDDGFVMPAPLEGNW